MVENRSVVAGLLFGALIFIFGLALIFAKDWIWPLFEFFYGMLGIQAQRAQLWQTFITIIGLGISAFGLFTIWAIWKIKQNSR